MSVWWILTVILVLGSITLCIFASKERGIIFAVSTLFSIMLTIICAINAVAFPLLAKKDILMFKATKTTISLTESFMNEEVLHETVENANAWLTSAKADIRTFGIFSKYYKSGVEDLDYIVLKNEN